jgi:group I intron endonuclease
MITNTQNGKSYVGITTRTVSRRWSEHCFVPNSCGQLLNKAINKYGKDAFIIETIASAKTLKDLKEVEKQLINQNQTKVPHGYNLTDGGDGVFGYKFTEEAKKRNGDAKRGTKASEQTKKKMQESHLGEKNPFYGKKHTPETLKKMSEILKTKDCRQKTTNKGKKFPEAGSKISAARKEYFKTNIHPMLGVKRTTDMRLNNSLGALNQQKHKCVYCDVVTIAGNIKRWHNDNCKDKG